MNQPRKLAVTTHADVIQLQGVMDDAMDTYGLKEALKGQYSSISFRSVSSASWNGLLRFDDTVRSSGAPMAKLDDLPYGIFRMMRMLDKFSDFYMLGSVEAPFLDPAKKEVQMRLVEEGAGSLENGSIFFGRKQHFRSIRDGNSPKLWDVSRLSAVLFDYALYCETIFLFVSDIASSIEVSIGRVVGELSSQSAAIRAACEAVGVNDLSSLDNLTQVLKRVAGEVGGTAKSILDVAKPAQADMGRIALEVAVILENGGEIPVTILDELCGIIVKTQPITSLAEDFGVLIGDLYQAYDLTKFAAPLKERINAEATGPEQVQLVIDALCIMDPMAEEKDVLIESLAEYFAGVELEVNKASTISQSCDLMRQIVEHRINEAKLMLSLRDMLAEDPSNVDTVAFFRGELIALIEKKMVTDQEKLAMKFFMPREEKAADASAQPGDMLLF